VVAALYHAGDLAGVQVTNGAHPGLVAFPGPGFGAVEEPGGPESVSRDEFPLKRDTVVATPKSLGVATTARTRPGLLALGV
jgi:hypothetical protein